MRSLIDYLLRLSILLSGLALGVGCNALPNPIPFFDLGTKKLTDAQSASIRDIPSQLHKDQGILDLSASPGLDYSTYGDAQSDGIQDGLKLKDGAADGVKRDGEVDDVGPTSPLDSGPSAD